MGIVIGWIFLLAPIPIYLWRAGLIGDNPLREGASFAKFLNLRNIPFFLLLLVKLYPWPAVLVFWFVRGLGPSPWRAVATVDGRRVYAVKRWTPTADEIARHQNRVDRLNKMTAMAANAVSGDTDRAKRFARDLKTSPAGGTVKLTTIYGYQAPPEAVLVSWRCTNRDCDSDVVHIRDFGGSETRLRKSFTGKCPRCGSAADPHFDEPWQHEATGVRLRYLETASEQEQRQGFWFEGALLEWQIEDAGLKKDKAALAAARDEARAFVAGRVHTGEEHSEIALNPLHHVIQEDLRFGDIDDAMEDFVFLASRLKVDAQHRGEGNYNFVTRTLVERAGEVLGAPGGAAHPRSNEVRRLAVAIGESNWDSINLTLQGIVTKARQSLPTSPASPDNPFNQ